MVAAVFDLDLLDQRVRERADGWGSAGVTWTLHRGPSTPKPAAWVVCETAEAAGQLTVWVSGEAELEVGYVDRDDFHAVHYDLEDDGALRDCLDELTRLLLSQPPPGP